MFFGMKKRVKERENGKGWIRVRLAGWPATAEVGPRCGGTAQPITSSLCTLQPVIKIGVLFFFTLLIISSNSKTTQPLQTQKHNN